VSCKFSDCLYLEKAVQATGPQAQSHDASKYCIGRNVSSQAGNSYGRFRCVVWLARTSNHAIVAIHTACQAHAGKHLFGFRCLSLYLTSVVGLVQDRAELCWRSKDRAQDLQYHIAKNLCDVCLPVLHYSAFTKDNTRRRPRIRIATHLHGATSRLQAEFCNRDAIPRRILK
jgi:hypothetical protein